MVYVAFWVGVPFASLLLGDVWRLISPWRAIGRGSGWLAARVGGDALPEPLAYPARLGPLAGGGRGARLRHLRAVLGDRARARRRSRSLMLVYVVVMLVGMSLYGVEAWTRNADPFGVYFGLFASLAPFTRRDGALTCARPSSAPAGSTRVAGTAAVILTGHRRDRVRRRERGAAVQRAAAAPAGLLRRPRLFAATALELGFVDRAVRRGRVHRADLVARGPGMPPSTATARRALVHSLVPILAAYVVAHYFSLLAYNGQDLVAAGVATRSATAPTCSAAPARRSTTASSRDQIWYVQVGALVLGHVAALVLAHDRALVLYGSHRDATRSQLVMLVLMVVFTCLGLWLLSAANG